LNYLTENLDNGRLFDIFPLGGRTADLGGNGKSEDGRITSFFRLEGRAVISSDDG
jgi:hypothetical protein